LRHNLLLAGLAFTLAILAGPSVPAQAPRPVDPPKSDGVQPATANQDKPKTAASDRDAKVKPALGEPTDPTLHRMEIITGPTRNVHYYAIGGSPTEQATLNKLSQAENELAYHESQLALRQQYVNTESLMESRRREQQQKLYGLNMDEKSSSSNTLSGLGLGEPSPYGPGSGWTDRFAGPALGGAFGALGPVGPFNGFGAGRGFSGALGGLGAFGGLGGIGPFGSGFAGGVFPLGFGGLGLGGASGFPYGSQGTPWSAYDINRVTLKHEGETNQSLANGIGDEGKFKTAMVMEMARQMTPESTSTALRNYDSALANAVAARLNREPGQGGITAASLEKMTPPKVEVTTRGGEKISGYLTREDADWVVIRTTDSEERIRPADITRMKRELPKLEIKKAPK